MPLARFYHFLISFIEESSMTRLVPEYLWNYARLGEHQVSSRRRWLCVYNG